MTKHVLSKSSKGISPLIASVLLIAFSVAVFGIIQMWGISFVKTQTEDVSNRTDRELNCVYGGITVSNLKYCNHYFSGIVKNSNQIDLKNITLQIIYLNATNQKFPLNNSVGGAYMTINAGEMDSFNISMGGSNYDRLHFYTLTCPDVYDDAISSDVTSC